MWQHIGLSSLGVIEAAELDLGEGFSVITGETGAGKTMVVTALGLLRGQRADTGLVRHGSKQARVEASIVLPGGTTAAASVVEAGGELDDGVLILGRVLSAQGRSRAFAGGATVPASVLTSVTDELVAVHGQSDQFRLLRPAEQRAALDAFAGEAFADVAARYEPAYARWRAVEKRLAELRAHAQERARELDQTQYGLDEIGAIEPQPGEDEQLRVEEGRLAHAEALVRAASIAHEQLAGDLDAASAGRARVAEAAASLQDVAGNDPALDVLAERIHELGILIDEVAADLMSYADGVDLDPARLAGVQERRGALTALQRKYGPSLDEVLAWAEKAAARVLELADDDDSIETLQAERDALLPEVLDLAQSLSRIRADAAVRLSHRVDEEIAMLSMPSAHLEVVVSTHEDAQPGPHGLDEVELLFAANSGMNARPLNRGASGGELSRLMLALEVVLADRSTVPTLVFDEVDAGIGGKAAVEVGRRLAALAQHAQVIAVTHLPQVAAFADHHFRVSKDDDGVVTSSSVVRLDGDERVDELARMLAGQEASSTAQAHARELLEMAQG